jgi:hypothetical protein
VALWKRGRRYWARFTVNGRLFRIRLCPPGVTRATTRWQEAVNLEKEAIRAATEGELAAQTASVKLFAAVNDYLTAKKATANTVRAVQFDTERLEVVKRIIGDVKLASITRATIEHLQATRRQHGRRRAAPGAQALQTLAEARG